MLTKPLKELMQMYPISSTAAPPASTKNVKGAGEQTPQPAAAAAAATAVAVQSVVEIVLTPPPQSPPDASASTVEIDQSLPSAAQVTVDGDESVAAVQSEPTVQQQQQQQQQQANPTPEPAATEPPPASVVVVVVETNPECVVVVDLITSVDGGEPVGAAATDRQAQTADPQQVALVAAESDHPPTPIPHQIPSEPQPEPQPEPPADAPPVPRVPTDENVAASHLPAEPQPAMNDSQPHVDADVRPQTHPETESMTVPTVGSGADLEAARAP